MLTTITSRGGRAVSDETVGQSDGFAPRRRRVSPWVFGGIGVIVVAATVAIPVSISAAQQAAAEEEAARIAAEAQEAEESRLATFRNQITRCGITSPMVSVLDGGEALQMTRVTKYDGPAYAQLTCLLQGLEAPSVIEAEIGQTRALDGRQSSEWEGYSISWSYHPDDGASILIRHQGDD